MIASLLFPGPFLGLITKTSMPAANPSKKAQVKTLAGIGLKAPMIKSARPKHSVGAWLPYWDQDNALRSFKQNRKTINELSPYWYFVKSDGKLSASSKFDLRAVKQAKKEGIKVIPMVSNDFDGARISKIINNPQLRKTHIRELTKKVVDRDLDGIDLDYEGLLQKDRRMYAYFIQKLAAKLHKYDKILSVTLQAKVKAPGHTQATKAQDWKKIGKYADRLRIMAYDYHWKTSPPGPIAPKTWVDKIARFAKKTVPAHKAIIAVGTYGYDWRSGRAKPITLDQARNLAKKHKKRIKRDPRSGELYLKLKPGKPQIWLQDHGSLRPKLKIVKKYGLGGIVFWRLGDEDPKVWKVVRNQFS